MTKLLFRLFVALVLILALMQIAAAGDTAKYANAIAAVVILVSPFLIQLVKARFGIVLDGRAMVAIAYVVSLLIALGAGLAGGEYHPDLSSLPALLASSTLLFGVQQLVFASFKDDKTVGPLLK